ncbi:hypothetical protein GQ53DRAFT_750070 [Thozetella sp. PMI_491]|nr:hypothetical protein GQ53DRAFT_750070 [Thozetella sp. PMI_491]
MTFANYPDTPFSLLRLVLAAEANNSHISGHCAEHRPTMGAPAVISERELVNGAEGFHRFSYLPYELRHAIWCETLPRRVVALNPEMKDDVHGCRTTHPRISIVPEIAQVCAEARSVVYRCGTRAYDMNRRPVFFDPNTDFLLINDWPGQADEEELIRSHHEDPIAQYLLCTALRHPRTIVLSRRLANHRFTTRCFERLANIDGGITLCVSSYILRGYCSASRDRVAPISVGEELWSGKDTDRGTAPLSKLDTQANFESFEGEWLWLCIAGGHPCDAFGRADKTVYTSGWNKEHPWVQTKLASLPRIRNQGIWLHHCED